MISLIGKFEETGSTQDDLKGKAGRHVTVRTEENIEVVSNILENDPETSVRRVAQQVGLSYGTTRTIMRKDLNLYPYKNNYNNN